MPAMSRRLRNDRCLFLLGKRQKPGSTAAGQAMNGDAACREKVTVPKRRTKAIGPGSLAEMPKDAPHAPFR